MIKESTVIYEVNCKVFMEKLSKVIDEFQTKGYKVEIQYKMYNGNFSALIIARDK